MLDWLVHLGRLLTRSLDASIVILGTSTFGLIVSITVLVAPFVLDVWKKGRIRAALKGWRKTLGQGALLTLFVYVVVFTFSLFCTVMQKPVEEPTNSLRRRVIHLTDDLDAFPLKRNENRPLTGGPDEQRSYAQETEDLYTVQFSHQTVGIIQELKAKGLLTEPYYAYYGPVASNRMLDSEEVDHLRDLAHYLDAKDNVVWIDGR
jgi:hypothetical protein